MSQSQPAGRALRGVSLLSLGALALHQVTYLLAGGADLHAAGLPHRHAYLAELGPALAGASLAAITLSIAFSALRRRLPTALDPQCVTERAAAYAAALLVVYLTQELTEALFADGGSPLVEATLGGGAWLALPLALAFGAAAAAVGDALDRAELRLALALRVRARRAPRAAGAPAAPPRRALATRTLAFGLSRRPPPLPTAG